MTNSDIFGGLKICTTLDFHFCYFLQSLVYKIFWVEILQVCRIHRCLYLGFFQFFLTVKCCFQFLERNPICGTSCICSFLIGVRHFVACSPFFFSFWSKNVSLFFNTVLEFIIARVSKAPRKQNKKKHLPAAIIMDYLSSMAFLVQISR
jgi:hypothetical protein